MLSGCAVICAPSAMTRASFGMLARPKATATSSGSVAALPALQPVKAGWAYGWRAESTSLRNTTR